jgi:hypothetical protein
MTADPPPAVALDRSVAGMYATTPTPNVRRVSAERRATMSISIPRIGGRELVVKPGRLVEEYACDVHCPDVITIALEITLGIVASEMSAPPLFVVVSR